MMGFSWCYGFGVLVLLPPTAAGNGGGNKFRSYTRWQFISLSWKESDSVLLSLSNSLCLSGLVWSHFVPRSPSPCHHPIGRMEGERGQCTLYSVRSPFWADYARDRPILGTEYGALVRARLFGDKIAVRLCGCCRRRRNPRVRKNVRASRCQLVVQSETRIYRILLPSIRISARVQLLRMGRDSAASPNV